MARCGNLFNCMLVAIVLVIVADSAAPSAEKLATCCESVTTKEITEEVQGYLIQTANPPCVNAVIFQTKSGLYCAYGGAPWVRTKIRELRAAKARATPSSTASLLSIITSTASPPSTSAPVSSSALPSTSYPTTELLSEDIQ